TYCPHLNPIERLWGAMHKNVTHNKCYETCAQFAEAALDFLRDQVPKRWAELSDSVTDNFRIISPKDFRLLRRSKYKSAKIAKTGNSRPARKRKAPLAIGPCEGIAREQAIASSILPRRPFARVWRSTPKMVHGRPRLQTAGGLSAEAAESVAVKWLRKRSYLRESLRLLDDKASLLRPSSFSSKPPTPYGQCAAAATLRTLILALQPRPPNSREHWTQTGAAVSL